MRLPITFLLAATLASAAASPEKIENVRALLRDRKVAEAESAAKTLVAANPGEAEAHALLGSISLAKGEADAAVESYEKATQLAPANSDYQRQLGDAYGVAAQKAGMLSKMSWAKKCRLAYEKSVSLDPTNYQARSGLMTLYQHLPSVMGGGVDKAYAQAAEIKKLDPARGRTAYAMLYAGEKKFTEAFAELEEVLKETPDDYTALFQFGRFAALSGEHVDRGMEALKKCLTLNPPSGAPGHEAAHWRLGNLWEKKGDKKSARAEYEAALAINPKFPQAIDSLKKLD
jgi:tetratricopeptide (TPR) repeat protein